MTNTELLRLELIKAMNMKKDSTDRQYDIFNDLINLELSKTLRFLERSKVLVFCLIVIG